MNQTNSKEDEIMFLLKERHMTYADISPEKAKNDPHWMYKKPISEREYAEWIEFGVNTIISVMGVDRRKAEMEMSWVESKYGMRVK
jgi:hypothetical protein